MFDIPFLDLPPLHRAAGTVRLPGSKSISNRALLLAGLAAGTTRLHGLLDSDDTQVMREALLVLGCAIEPLDDGSLKVDGLGGRLKVRQASLFLGNAGTAMRPLTAALALLAATQGGSFELRGVPRMHQRPIGDLVDTLRALGCSIDDLGQPGYPPSRVHGSAGMPLRLEQPLRVRGDVSSQFLTALLMTLPLVSDARALHVEVDGELISKPYVQLTLELLARFGVPVQRDGWHRFTVPQHSRIRSPGDFQVEADASSASYFIALGAIAASPQQPLHIEGVGSGSIQGDIGFVQAAAAMGAQVRSDSAALQVSRGAWPLRAVTLDCNAMPDAAMTLCAMALFADGTTRLNRIGSWRVKETDRIAAMAAELRKLGATVEAGDDFIAVTAPRRWRAASLHTYDDHRMAMCLSLASLNALAARDASDAAAVPVRILDPRCVAKTYPDYFEHFFAVTQADPVDVPVITVDGPSASGKGTLAEAVAAALGYHLLDSGALYRAAALAAIDDGLDDGDPAALARIAAALDLRFEGTAIRLRGRQVNDALRLEPVGAMASRISALPAVRQALHARQLSFRRAPGLVADGRDMGSVVFPDAHLKVFLTASAEQRAQRRHKQLISKGIDARLIDLRADLEARDLRDTSRAVAPLKPAEDAMPLDNSGLSIEESVAVVLSWWQQRRPFDPPG